MILAISHGSGVNFGRCGKRFNGYTVEGSTVIIDWRSPGGFARCPASMQPATYAVALDRDLVVLGKLTAIFWTGPDDRVSQGTNIFPGAVTTAG